MAGPEIVPAQTYDYASLNSLALLILEQGQPIQPGESSILQPAASTLNSPLHNDTPGDDEIHGGSE